MSRPTPERHVNLLDRLAQGDGLSRGMASEAPPPLREFPTVPRHVAVQRFDRRIATLGGRTLVTYHQARCACGITLVVRQSGNFLRERQGFNASDEIHDAMEHFTGHWLSTRTAPQGPTQTVVIDTVRNPWTDSEIEQIMDSEEETDGLGD